MAKLIWISDFFSNEVNGGAEICDSAYMEKLNDVGYEIEKIKCKDVTIDTLKENRDKLFFVSNFMQFPHELLKYMVDNKIKYIHVAHDHAYCIFRNPYKHGSEMKCDCYPKDGPLHNFLTNAMAIICQSQMHKDAWEKNSLNTRTVNVGNSWSKKSLDYISGLVESAHSEEYLIFDSPYEHKNTSGAIQEAVKSNVKYKLVSGLGQEEFLKELSASQGIIFLPVLLESCSRLLVEARMLGIKIKTNKLCGCTGEEYFKMKGKDLIEYSRNEQPKKLVELVKVLYENKTN